MGNFHFLFLHVRSLQVTTHSDNTKQAEQTEISTLLGSDREVRTQAPRLKRQANTRSHRAETQSRNCSGNQCWSRKTWTGIDELLEAQGGPVWELKLQEHQVIQAPPQLFKFYLNQVPRVNKNPFTLPAGGEGKRNHFEIGQSALCLTRPQEKLVNEDLTRWGFIRAWLT